MWLKTRVTRQWPCRTCRGKLPKATQFKMLSKAFSLGVSLVLLHRVSVITRFCPWRPCSDTEHWAKCITQLASCDLFSKFMSDLLEDHIVYGSWEAFTASKRSRILTTVVDLETGDSWAECQEKENNLRNSAGMGSNSSSTTL